MLFPRPLPRPCASASSGISLTGGAGGGGSDAGNLAQIRSTTGSQSVTVGSGGLHLTGGGGTLTDNIASLSQGGTSGTSQTITVNGGGSATESTSTVQSPTATSQVASWGFSVPSGRWRTFWENTVSARFACIRRGC